MSSTLVLVAAGALGIGAASLRVLGTVFGNGDGFIWERVWGARGE